VFSLVLAAIFLFSFAATLDPFLNLWDERFHALVAKNLMNHPFLPTLYDNPIVLMEYNIWDRYHIWFHKQPLFLWQISLSFKLFGVSEFSLRIPNIIMGVILTYITYRTGKVLTNYKVGIVAGLLLCTSNYLLELVSGYQGLDHNDFSFLFYVSLSIWAFVEYSHSENRKWLFLIGLFSGFAILCKWLVGLLVYFGWGVIKLRSKKFHIKEYFDLILALIVTIVVAAPWQLYEFIAYPVEAAKEYAFYGAHFREALEGHTGTWLYHFEQIPKIYSVVGAFVLLPSFFLLKRNLKEPKLYLYITSNILVVYVFFSFAQTKMPSFTVIVFMLVIIAIASFLVYIFDKLFHSAIVLKKISFAISIIVLILLNINIESLQANHTLWKKKYPNREALIQNRKIFKDLKLPKNTAIFNVKGRHYIECMFYTDLPSYNFIPSELQYADLKRKDYKMAIFKSKKLDIPDYLKNDKDVILLDNEILGYR
jgi:4-amino-4-deoxy-L-arabinose transferase